MATSTAHFVEELQRRYDAVLQRALRNCAPPDEVADLVNECYLRLLALEDPTSVRQPRAFLLRTARNLATDRSRRRGLEVTSDALPAQPDDLPGSAASPEEQARSEQLQSALDEALADLPRITATVFRMRRLQGYGSAAIAQDLGLTQRTVQKHLATAMVFLERRLRAFLVEGRL